MMLLLTLLLFVFNWDRIKTTLEMTGFFDVVGTVNTSPGVNDRPSAPVSGDGSLAPGESKPGTEPLDKPQIVSPKPIAETPKTTTPPTESQKPIEPGTMVPKVVTPPAKSPMEQVKSTRVVVLFLVRVDDDGIISRHEVKRTVGVSDSPLTDALNALMSGPNTDELNRGYISLIPSEARLLSAQVRGSTAYLNFNEAFMYNRYGIEGYAGQLKQIVYSATDFSTVKDVQILIEGQKRDYLGGDGVYIGKPLSRASF
jgi:spore germination protein GerM